MLTIRWTHSSAAVAGLVLGACTSSLRTLAPSRPSALSRPPTASLTFDGDFVMPRFSPDGSRLAVGQVVVADSFESSRLLILTLASGRLDTLMDARRVRGYGWYAASLVGVKWSGPDTVTFTIHDGDVGATNLVFDASTHALLTTYELEENNDADLMPNQQALLRRLSTLYPAYPADVIVSALNMRSYFEADSAVVLQFNYYRYNHSIRRFDLRRPDEQLLLEPNPPCWHAGSFLGGAEVGATSLLAVCAGYATNLYLAAPGRSPEQIASLETSRFHAHVEVRWRGRDGAAVLIPLHTPYEPGANRALWFDGSRITSLVDVPNLSDFDVSPRGDRMAVSHWVGNQRHLVVQPAARR